MRSLLALTGFLTSNALAADNLILADDLTQSTPKEAPTYWSAGKSALIQYTPTTADWSQFQLSDQYEDHGVPEGWPTWDGVTIYKPMDKDTEEYMSKEDFADSLCPGGKLRGLQGLYDQVQPFNDEKNPKTAEIDNWHTQVINHIRALIGYGQDHFVKPEKCLFQRCQWSAEKFYTDKWDTPEYLEKYDWDCLNSNDPHCGGGFIPSDGDQALDLGVDPACVKKMGIEMVFTFNTGSPWAIKIASGFCNGLRREGFWGPHVYGWFHKEYYGMSFGKGKQGQRPDKGAFNRIKFAKEEFPGTYPAEELDPEIYTVNGAEATFDAYRCNEKDGQGNDNGQGLQLGGAVQTAQACYELMLEEDQCGKQYLLYNYGNKYCKCYTSDMTFCKLEPVAGRKLWNFNDIPEPDFVSDPWIHITSIQGSQECIPTGPSFWSPFYGGSNRHCAELLVQHYKQKRNPVLQEQLKASLSSSEEKGRLDKDVSLDATVRSSGGGCQFFETANCTPKFKSAGRALIQVEDLCVGDKGRNEQGVCICMNSTLLPNEQEPKAPCPPPLSTPECAGFAYNKDGVKTCVENCPDDKKFFLEKADGTKKCVKNCPDDKKFFLEKPDGTKKCVKKCKKEKPFVNERNDGTKKCVKKCPDGKPYYYKKGDGTKTCVKACSASGDKKKFVLEKDSGNKCVETCPKGMEGDESTSYVCVETQ